MRDDESDGRVYLALGQAVARAQEVEVVMVRLLEQQRQDTSLPLDDRWDEISAWLELTAAQLRPRLGVPDVVAADLKAAVGRRNRVAHDAWMLYSAATNRKESAATWVPWLQREATMLMQVRRGLAYVTRLLSDARASGSQVDDADVLRVVARVRARTGRAARRSLSRAPSAPSPWPGSDLVEFCADMLTLAVRAERWRVEHD